MPQLSYSIAPQKLWQSINPWKFDLQNAQIGLFNISVGDTPAPEVEEAVLNDVGSYGRQLGRISDALEVLIKHRDGSPLTKDDKDTIEAFLGQVADVRKVKKRFGRG